jgi:hypothetical protein
MQQSLLLSVLYMFQAVFRPSSEAQTMYSIWYMSSLLVVTASMGELAEPTHPC